MRILVFIFLFVVATKVRAQDSLFANGPAQVQAINVWYSATVRQYDSAKALGALDKLYSRAMKEGNHAAEAAGLFYKGQYMAIGLHHFPEGIALMNRGISIAEIHSNKLQWATFTHRMGYFYFYRKQYSLSLLMMLRANEAFKKIGYANVFNQGPNLYELAFVYFHLANYEQAIRYCQTALENSIPNVKVKIFVVNTIGECYEKLFRPDSALVYYQRAYQIAADNNISDWVGITSGNMGAIYYAKSDLGKARSSYETYYKSSVESNTWICIVEALTGLARVDISENHPEAALTKLERARNLFDSGTRNVRINVEDYPRQLGLYKTFAAAYDKLHEYAKAYPFEQLANVIKDSMDKRALLGEAYTVQQQLDAEQRMAQIALIEKDKESALLKRKFLFCVIILLLVIALLAYNRLLLKNRRNKELHLKREALLLSENKRAQAELLHAENLLKNYTDSLRQKTELLQQFEAEIEAINSEDIAEGGNPISALSSLVKSSILTPDDWSQFKLLFENVHSGFFARLQNKYPEASPAETRLIALTKIKLSTIEMAAMLGVNTETIKKTRQRLRKSLNMPVNASIYELVEAI